MELSIIELVLASGLPVIEVAIMCLFGACLVWKDVIKHEEWRVLTKLMYFLFFPCLVITSLGSSVTGASLLSWWPLPASTLLNVVLGMSLAAAVFPCVDMPAYLRPHFISCAGVGSLGNLLIVLVPSIASKSSLFSDKDGDQGLAYVFAALFAICVAAFTVVGALLQQPQTPNLQTVLPSPADVKLGISATAPMHGAAPTPGGQTPSPFHCVGEPAGSFSLRHARELEQRSASGAQNRPDITSHLSTASTAVPHSHRLHQKHDEATLRGSSRSPTLVSALFASHYYSQRLTLDGMSAGNSNVHCPGQSTQSMHSTQSTQANDASKTNPVNKVKNAGASGVVYDACTDSVALAMPTTILNPRGRAVHDLQSIEKSSLTIALSSQACVAAAPQHTQHTQQQHATQLNSQFDLLQVLSSDLPEEVQTSSSGKSASPPRVLRPGQTNNVQDSAASSFSGSGNSMHAQQTVPSTALPWLTKFWKVAKSMLNVPTMAIALGLVVACTPSLRQLFYGPDEVTPEGGDDVKGTLDVVTSALRRVGAAAIPCMMISLGGALSKGPGDSKVSTKAVVALVAIRLVILPAVGGWVVLSGQSAGLWADKGKMFTLVLTLQHAMPTAVNVHAVAAMHDNHEKVVAALLFWQYIACIVTIPICVSIYLSQIVG